ncbi:MDR/zinc-dependent alcohol dehydrogenase-like family protein [Candidatus Pelagibacter sp. FZCC0015]|uniref:MDR/zinc-dependent alcohol dehydrogenase-like family protein n=1 Tax=Candidatus Pelagibacter sp. FZCC0015 TaxID=2268451 RepID=UPI0011A432A8|nr:medium chain dehydrogenase/reductase family protein [Candidatus Pelagibacter sp. FZCC0015]
MLNNKNKDLIFKAAILTQLKKKLLISNIKFNDKLNRGQVLIKMYYSGICGSQIGEINGVKGKDNFLPHLLGHEGTGIIINKNKYVKKFKIGDRVILHWQKGEGYDSCCPTYFKGKKKINAGKVTTFNEFAVVSENRITRMPKGISEKQAVIFGCALTTGFGAVVYDAKVKKKKSILIFGAGGIGMSLIQILSLMKPKKIIIVDSNINKKKIIKKFKQKDFVLFKNNDLIKLKEKILNKNKGNCFDYVFDTTGNGRIIELGLDLMLKKSKLILLGVQNFKEKISFNTLQVVLGKKIIGSTGGNVNPTKDIPLIYKLIKKNNINLNNFYNKIFKLSEINKAIKYMSQKKSYGRILIKF